MYDLFNFDLDSDRIKSFIKEHILKIMIGLIVIMVGVIGFMVFNIVKPKEQIKTNYIAKTETASQQKDLLKVTGYQKTVGYDFVQKFFMFDTNELNATQKLVAEGQLKDDVKKAFANHHSQKIESIKLLSSTKQMSQNDSNTISETNDNSIIDNADSTQEVYQVVSEKSSYMIIVLLQDKLIRRFDYVEMVH